MYPLSAPNGSKIIVCGHDHGLLFVWRGGRPFKADTRTHTTTLSTPDVMALDEEEDDDDESKQSDNGEPDFTDEVEEFDPAKPYMSIIQHLDLPLETPVLHLAFPRLPQLSHPRKHPLSPPLLQHKMVVAVTCADNSIRLLTLPLKPPSPASKSRSELREDPTLCHAGHGSWGEELVTIQEVGCHQSLPRGVAVGIMPQALQLDDEEEGPSRDEPTEAPQLFDILLASHSADLSGLLLLHKIPVSEDGMFLEPDASENLLWRFQPLSSRASTIDLWLPTNTTQIQVPRVLVAEANGAVKIFECFSESSPDRGAWSLSMYPGCATGVNYDRRLVLDARWALGGRAVIVLTADGEWGIWDISPAKGSNGISGGVPTKFAINGWITGPGLTGTRPKSSNAKTGTKTQLAPMTPSTRKVRQEALFSGHSTKSSISMQGGISIHVTDPSISNKEEDESLVIWHDNRIITIPSLRTHWQNKFKTSNSLFSNGASGQIRDIPDLDLRGEFRTSVSAFPAEDSLSSLKSKQPDILISGERSIGIIAVPLEPSRPTVVDYKKLAARELDVNGLDRMLDSMANGSGPLVAGDESPSAGKRRKVGFKS